MEEYNETNSENLLEKVALCRTGITDNTDIDISAEVCSFLRDFMYTTKQHQQDSTFYLVITCTQSTTSAATSTEIKQTYIRQ